MSEGIDVSKWRGRPNWWAVRHVARKRFAFAQCTYGTGEVDPQFPRNWRLMRARGLVRGAIHCLYPDLSGRDQAEYLHYVIRKNGGMVPGDWLILEVELRRGATGRRVAEACEEWLEDVIRYRSPTGDRHVALYSAHWFWSGVLGDPSPGPHTARVKQWLADYSRSKPPPPLTDFRGPVAFWQYSSSGRCAGVNPPTDLDRYLLPAF